MKGLTKDRRVRSAAIPTLAIAAGIALPLGTTSHTTVLSRTTISSIGYANQAPAARTSVAHPYNTVTGTCGTASLGLTPTGGGKGTITLVFNSNQGPISSLGFVGVWDRTNPGFAAGGFTAASGSVRGLGTSRVIAVIQFNPGAGNVNAALIESAATVPGGACTGLFPSDGRIFP